MAKKSVKKGQEFVEGILQHVPEDQREAVKAALMAEGALDYVGSAALRQEEFSALAAETQAKAAEANALIAKNQEWYQNNLPLLNKGASADKLEAEVKKLTKRLKAVQADPDADPEDVDAATDKFAKATENLISKDAAKALVDDAVRSATLSTQQSGLDLVITISDLSARHLADFKEPLNSRDLITFAQKNNTNIVDAYNKMNAEKMEARAESLKSEERAALKKQVREELLKEMPSQGHGLYPVGSAEPISSTLGALKPGAKPNAPVDVIDRAVNAYNDLLSKRGA